jgi:hypothetical protein
VPFLSCNLTFLLPLQCLNCNVQEQQNEIGRDLAALAQPPGSGRDPRMQLPAPAEPNQADGDDEYDPEDGGMVF